MVADETTEDSIVDSEASTVDSEASIVDDSSEEVVTRSFLGVHPDRLPMTMEWSRVAVATKM